MATSTSSSTQVSSSGTDEADLQQVVVDIRKRKRMQSNRESARRSRLRKQKHMDELMAQVTELKAQKDNILTTTTATTQLYMDVEAENSVLRAQLSELSNRLQSLNDIINCLNNNNNNDYNNNHNNNSNVNDAGFGGFDYLEFDDGSSMNSWGFSFANYPIMATQDAFMC
ncbi:bZIP transcription factor 44 [Bienertia sinuspersici]